MEDEELLARGMQSLLRDSGDYVVDVARDGCEAQRMLDRERYTIVILDWNLPCEGPSGLELCSALRARSSRVGILFVTARQSVRDRIPAFNAGADDYLVKPFEAAELLARVNALARRSEPPSRSVAYVGRSRAARRVS
ncbi:MAG: response regulator transcription factor [Burkholderiales bacterium]